MGRTKGATNKVEVPDWARPTYVELLAGLGVDERAVTEGFGSKRAQVNLDLMAAERQALDDAAEACGVGAAAKLARAIVRSWLVHPWNHPAGLRDHDFGEGWQWSDALTSVEDEAQWFAGATGPVDVLATLASRLGRSDLLAVTAALASRLSARDKQALKKTLG